MVGRREEAIKWQPKCTDSLPIVTRRKEPIFGFSEKIGFVYCKRRSLEKALFINLSVCSIVVVII